MISKTIPDLISNYQLNTKDLSSKQETFYLTQALNEFGNLYFAQASTLGSYRNPLNAEENWKSSIDKIFNKHETLKDFRKHFQECKYNLAHQYGIQQCLIACELLYKLSNFCFFGNLQMQYESIYMASEICFSVFKCTLPHAHIPLLFGMSTIKEIIVEDNIFTDKWVIDPANLAVACDKIAWMLIDYEFYVRALPFLTLLEYVSTEVLK